MSRASSFTGRRIAPGDWHFPKGPNLTDEQHDFVRTEIARGLTDLEVTRMFFRHFGRDITGPTVARYRDT